MSSPSRTVGVVGLGLMGTAVCERLLSTGYTPVVWNRTTERAAPLLSRGAVWSNDPLADCERVLICLYNSDVVAEVLSARESGLRPGQTLIDTTTGDPGHSAAWAARLAARGVAYLDAPISGSSEQTRRGEATVIVSGDPTAYSGCSDLWPVLGQRTFYVGASGAAARMKLVTNLVLGLNRAALAEGLVLAEALRLDLHATLNVLQGSPAYSRQMDTKGRKMLGRDFTLQARLSQHLKDVRLMLQAADEHGLSLTLTDAHRRLLEHAESLGLGELDNSAVIEAVRRPTP